MAGVKALAALVFWVVLCLVAGFIGSLFTAPAVATWYRDLQKPAWSPPNWAFAPVWTALYVAMGVAAWLVWRRAVPGVPAALALFAVQLALNVAWSGLFFGLHSPGTALLDIVLLWLAILATLVAFWRISPAAGILLLPYLGWVSFAASLNYTIWRMNR
jgi:benzodiazapine receptor